VGRKESCVWNVQSLPTFQPEEEAETTFSGLPDLFDEAPPPRARGRVVLALFGMCGAVLIGTTMLILAASGTAWWLASQGHDVTTSESSAASLP